MRGFALWHSTPGFALIGTRSQRQCALSARVRPCSAPGSAPDVTASQRNNADLGTWRLKLMTRRSDTGRVGAGQSSVRLHPHTLRLSRPETKEFFTRASPLFSPLQIDISVTKYMLIWPTLHVSLSRLQARRAEESMNLWWESLCPVFSVPQLLACLLLLVAVSPPCPPRPFFTLVRTCNPPHSHPCSPQEPLAAPPGPSLQLSPRPPPQPPPWEMKRVCGGESVEPPIRHCSTSRLMRLNLSLIHVAVGLRLN